jgi:hypothetical protein
MDTEIEVDMHVLTRVRDLVGVVPENRGMTVIRIVLCQTQTLVGYFWGEMVVMAWDLPSEQVPYSITGVVEEVHKETRHHPISRVPVSGVKGVVEMVDLRIISDPLGLQIQVVEVVVRRLVQSAVVMVVLV